jgi:ribosome-associated toxin RatA of RatAB toxin-antitoxin module
MASVRGERTVDIDAPIERCFAIAADLDRAPDWQPAMRSVAVLERDAAGRATLADAQYDATVRTLGVRLRLRYEEPVAVAWELERGDVKALHGRWALEDLGDGRTRATYALDVDPGRMLGLLLRGPAEASVREHLLGAADSLKAQAER